MASLSTQLVMKALDCLQERATVTAQNLANAGTAGYRPLRVTFETALAAAARQGPDAVKAVKPTIEHDPANAELRLDQEVSTASATALRYSALIEILNRRHQVDALPMSGGRQ